MNSKLDDGLIPPFTRCPVEPVCIHKGIKHAASFSCAVARGFNLQLTHEPE